MGQIILPGRYHPDFRRPGFMPSGPVEFNNSCKIAGGISSVAIPTPSGFIDLVGPQWAKTGSAGQAFTAQGRGMSFDGSTHYTAPNPLQPPVSQLYVLVHGANAVIGGSGIGSSTNVNRTQWDTYGTSGRFRAIVVDNGGGVVSAESGITPAADSICAVIFTAAPNGSVQVFFGGAKASSSASTSFGAFTKAYIGAIAFDPPNNFYVDPILFSASWGRVLADNEAYALLEDPGMLLRPANAPVYFIPSAGGGGATITGDSGSYTLTGTAATLKVGRKLTADSGTYSLTGTDVAFKRGYALSAESGTYTVSGTAVDLKAGRKLTADSGSYTLTGTDVTLNYSPAGSYNLTAESGTYTLTGTAATLKVSRKLTADSGAYPLTGTDVTLSKGVKLTADSGSYTLSGSNVAFSRTYVLTAESGAYTLTGTSAGLTWSGAPVVEAPTNGGPSIYGKPVFREKQFRKEYEEQVKRIEDEKRLARILREDEEITVIMALMAA